MLHHLDPVKMKTGATSSQAIHARRRALLDRLAALDEIRRGTIVDQYVVARRRDGSLHKRGPYPLLTRKQGKRTVSKRLTDPDLVPLYRQQIRSMRDFQRAVAELVVLGEQLSELAVTRHAKKRIES